MLASPALFVSLCSVPHDPGTLHPPSCSSFCSCRLFSSGFLCPHALVWPLPVYLWGLLSCHILWKAALTLESRLGALLFCFHGTLRRLSPNSSYSVVVTCTVSFPPWADCEVPEHEGPVRPVCAGLIPSPGLSVNREMTDG